jgi:hypothetical protein
LGILRVRILTSSQKSLSTAETPPFADLKLHPCNAHLLVSLLLVGTTDHMSSFYIRSETVYGEAVDGVRLSGCLLLSLLTRDVNLR